MFKRIAVGMSGGVDSAVTAYLLKKKGFNVTGVFMKNWDIRDETGKCLAEKDFEDAQRICDTLRIPLYQANFVKEYWNYVFSDLLEKYQTGYTPNPDVLCNKHIKFDRFFHLAREKFKVDAIATGHYAKTSFGPYLENYKPNTDVRLFKADDSAKEQTFFLCQIPQETLRHCMFPLGNYLKTEVKAIAQGAGLIEVAQKKESMGICFIGKREFQDFITEYIDNKPGDFIDLETGDVVGKHNGIHQWTIGQRCRITGASAGYYACYKDVHTNNIYAVKGVQHPALYSDMITLKDPHWIAGEPTTLKDNKQIFNCDFRFQHREPLVPCSVYKSLNNNLIVHLHVPLKAVTRGQYAVLYTGNECLGGAMIIGTGPSCYLLNREINKTSKQTDETNDIRIAASM